MFRIDQLSTLSAKTLLFLNLFNFDNVTNQCSFENTFPHRIKPPYGSAINYLHVLLPFFDVEGFVRFIGKVIIPMLFSLFI